MEYQNYIGKPLDDVLSELNKLGIAYIIEDNNGSKEKFDTVLVVKVEKVNDKLKIVTDKFLLNV